MAITKREGIIIGAGAVITGFVIYGLIRRHNNQIIIDKINAVLDSGSANDQSLVKVDVASLPSAAFPLKAGSVGIQVANVQRALNKKYQTQLDIDGKMGEATLQALCKYENFYCLFGVGASAVTVNETEYANMMKY